MQVKNKSNIKQRENTLTYLSEKYFFLKIILSFVSAESRFREKSLNVTKRKLENQTNYGEEKASRPCPSHFD